MEAYFQGFKDAADVFREFTVPEDEQGDVEILFAVYETPPYEGWAYVLFRKGGKLYDVEGGHCSCYGLENQWEPTETDVKTVLHFFEKGDRFRYRSENTLMLGLRLGRILDKIDLP